MIIGGFVIAVLVFVYTLQETEDRMFEIRRKNGYGACELVKRPSLGRYDKPSDAGGNAIFIFFGCLMKNCMFAAVASAFVIVLFGGIVG